MRTCVHVVVVFDVLFWCARVRGGWRGGGGGGGGEGGGRPDGCGLRFFPFNGFAFVVPATVALLSLGMFGVGGYIVALYV